MNNKRSAWILFSFMITFAILFTGCNPPATEEPAAPVDPAEEPIEEPPHPTDIYKLIEEYPSCQIAKDDSGVFCEYHENDYNIRISLPRADESDPFLVAIILPMDGELNDFSSPNDEFRPYQLITNFEVIDPNYPEKFISDFNPPMELEVQYTEADTEAVGGLENLQMGFWDEVNEYWVSFNKNPKYEFSIEGDKSGGFVRVIIPSWGDRRNAYGG